MIPGGLQSLARAVPGRHFPATRRLKGRRVRLSRGQDSFIQGDGRVLQAAKDVFAVELRVIADDLVVRKACSKYGMRVPCTHGTPPMIR